MRDKRDAWERRDSLVSVMDETRWEFYRFHVALFSPVSRFTRHVIRFVSGTTPREVEV